MTRAGKREVSEWTQKHGKSHNERRAARYAKDKAYRESIKARRRDRYHGTEKMGRTHLIKEYKGKTYTVYRVGEAAKKIGVEVSQLQEKVRQGFVPDSVFGGIHSYYTEGQVALLGWMFSHRGMKRPEVRKHLESKWHDDL